MKKFIILTTPRTGSTYIRMWLNQHPQIRCHGEVFLSHYDAPDGFLWFLRNKHSKLSRLYNNSLFQRIERHIAFGRISQILFRKGFAEYIESLFYSKNHALAFDDFSKAYEFHKAEQKKVDAIGFKLMFNQLKSNKNLQDWIIKEKPQIVFLERENLFQLCYSRFVNKKYNLYHTSREIEIKRTTVNPRDILNCIKQAEKINIEIDKKLKMFNTEVFKISYEDFFDDKVDVNSKLLQFLGINYLHDSDVKLKKVNKNALNNQIENYQEVKTFLIKNNYRKYIDEGT